jgi:glycopeptide antibiotics resistance protein
VKQLFRTVFAVYLLFLLWLVLFKFTLHIFDTFNFPIRGLNLIPFEAVTQYSWIDMVLNILFFVPFGLLLSVNLKQTPFGRKLAYIFLFSLIVEIIQYIFAIGITDITDVLANTTGGLLGLVLYGVTHSNGDSKKLDQRVTIATGTLIVILSVAAFTIQLSHERHRHLPAHRQDLDLAPADQAGSPQIP